MSDDTPIMSSGVRGFLLNGKRLIALACRVEAGESLTSEEMASVLRTLSMLVDSESWRAKQEHDLFKYRPRPKLRPPFGPVRG